MNGAPLQPGHLTLAHYIRFFSNPFYLQLLIRSIVMSLAVTVAIVVLSFPIAYLIAMHGGRWRMTWIVIISLPFWTSYLLRIFAWKVILGFNGVVNSSLIATGIITQPLDILLYNPFAVVLTHDACLDAFRGAADLCQPDEDPTRTAGGCDRSRRWPGAALPAGDAAAGAARRCLGRAAGVYPDGWRLCDADDGGRPQGDDDRHDHCRAVRPDQQLAAGFGDIGDHHGHGRARRAADPFRGFPHRQDGTIKRPPILLLGYAILWGIFLYAPVLLLPVFSFNDSTIVAFPLHGFTTQWYRQLADAPGLIAALQNSLMIAVIVAPVTTLLGLLCAWSVVRYRPPGTRAAVGIMMLPLVLPGLVLAVSLFMLVMALKIPLSVFTIGLGHLVVCLPFSISVLLSRLESFDRSLEEASRDLGENAFTTFRRIILPMAAPGIVSSLLLTFTISFDEFVVSFFLAGTQTTLPVYLWSQLRFPAKLPVVLALGSLVLLVSFVMISASEMARRFRPECRHGRQRSIFRTIHRGCH